jgi:hypothetical protein
VDQCLTAGVPPFVKAATLYGGKITKDIEQISNILGYPPEQLRQWPDKK